LNCKICNHKVTNIFSEKVLNKYDVCYYHCINCDFIQTDDPFWLSEAYSEPINNEDTGLVGRNLLFAKLTSMLLYNLFHKNGQFLDYAAGYGLFTRLMRDYGFDFYWHDPYTTNLFAQQFEFDLSLNKKFELVSAFECFEHFEQPISEIEKLIKLSDNILFSTELYSDSPPKPDNWDYYAFSHGQHIAFYSLNTLKHLAKKFNLNLYTNGKSFHLLTHKVISNNFYNLLLMLSHLGLPTLVKYLMGSKTLSDSKSIINNKKQKA